MRRLVQERPRVAALSALALVAVVVAAAAITSNVAGATGEQQRRAARAEQVAGERTRQLERVHRELKAVRSALAESTDRANTAERLADRRLGTARRWKVRALRVERRLRRAERSRR